MITALEVLADSRYLLLTTFRKNGTGVPTPVWAVRVGDELRVWTNPTAGKVKRLRRDSRALVAPCTQRGRPLGASIEVTGRVLSAAEAQTIPAALAGKYGWLGRLTQVGIRVATLIGRPRPPGGLALTFPSG